MDKPLAPPRRHDYCSALLIDAASVSLSDWNDMSLVGRSFGVVGAARRAALLLLGAVLSVGCAGRPAEASFARDFNCYNYEAYDEGNVHVFIGCGQVARYHCNSIVVGSVCSLIDDSAPRAGSSSDNARSPLAHSEVEVQNKGEGSVMVLELVLEGKALLRMTAMPEKQDVVQLKLIRREPTQTADSCSMDWMINGQIMATPAAVSSRKADVLSHRVQFKGDLIAELGTASQIALRVCRARWALTREQIFKVHEFIDRFEEELAWQKQPRAGSTGGMLAPSGGWPAWSAIASKLPGKLEGSAPDARELFKKLSPSVFLLMATSGDGTAQGSAVAISTTELVTNCHVVQGAQKLTRKQGSQEWPARVSRADPANDRCTVTTSALPLQPVSGMRGYDSLEVGEPVYTLGSPVGLELTLGSGIVSGRRDEDGHHYIQTSAPISPGSSGGGLFDARGNLIGVTTLVLAGRERLNQSLNFAIPIDAFYAP